MNTVAGNLSRFLIGSPDSSKDPRPVDNPNIDTNEAKKLMSTVRDLWDGYKERTVLYKRWMRTLSYYMGYHWTDYDYQRHKVESVPNTRKKVRMTVNRVLSFGRVYVSKMCRAKPVFLCVPGSRELSDYQASKAAQRGLDWFWIEHPMQGFQRELALLMYLQGTPHAHIMWDPMAGRRIKMGDEPIPEGDIRVEAVPAFEITPDWAARNLEESRYILRTRIEDKKALLARYPEGYLCQGETADSGSTSMELGTVWDAFMPITVGIGGAEKREKVRVHYYFERPTKQWPMGRRAVIADGKLWEYGDNDLLPDGELPFVRFTDIPVPSSYWGRATSEDLVELNHIYNRVRSQIVSSVQLMAWPKLLVPQGSPVASDTYYTSEEGEKIPFTAGQKPEVLSGSNVSPQAYQELDLLNSDMEEVSGQHELTRTGSPPGGVTAALAIQQLMELDDSRMASAYSSYEEGLQEVARMVISIMRDRYTVERMITISGRGSEPEYYSLSGASLMGNFDVRVQPGSGLATLKTAKQQLYLEMRKEGIIDNDRFIRLAELGGAEDTWEDLDKRRARWENSYLAQGMYVAPYDFDDHAKHLAEHDAYRKSPEFLYLDEQKQALFALHYDRQSRMLYLQSKGMSLTEATQQPSEPAPSVQEAAPMPPAEQPPVEEAPVEQPPTAEVTQ